MSAPRLVVCGLEPGPAVALAAGALLAAFVGRARRSPRPPRRRFPLWRLLHAASSRAPRVLDPRLIDDAVAGELYGAWSTESDLTASSPSSRRSTAGRGSKGRGRSTWRPRSTLRSSSSSTLASVAPPPPRAPAARACWPANVEFAGAIVVGGDDQGPAGELRRIWRTLPSCRCSDGCRRS